ncbi:hypothetical protein [Flavobacterium granuli]|uniref:DUF3037 domain-containing protein n=1 Tax=Flavobacterium granuli TaxID=280093 RepID=A0A1M5R318_9FLAO|nr:hypothetical protein [Flavobacterium granuli]PRZ21581.1 hypothetical protein BC624_10819 [Flavobacterium granuli]SHH20420.1 hypothetical protein SAMN05443373_10919 [Flavobacterium granuli]
MKTFFSIVSIQTNPISSEKVVMGVLAITGNEIYFDYSKSKLGLLDKLAPTKIGIGSMAKNALQQIKQKVTETNKVLIKDQQELVFEKSIFSKDYISYLNKYNNGILHFSEPASLPFDFTGEKFMQYYYNFVGEVVVLETKKEVVTFAKKIKPAFEKVGLEEKADLKFTFDPLTFNGILKETHIPLITKNGAINTIQIVDFSLGEQTVVHHLYETKIIKEALNVFAQKANTEVTKIKIVFEEPIQGTLQYDLFDLSVQNYKEDFDFITPDLLEKETEVICNSNNIKFSEFLLTL